MSNASTEPLGETDRELQKLRAELVQCRSDMQAVVDNSSNLTKDQESGLRVELRTRRAAITSLTYERAALIRELDIVRVALSHVRADNAKLRGWIRNEGDVSDVCTFDILGDICAGCRCPRRALEATAKRAGLLL